MGFNTLCLERGHLYCIIFIDDFSWFTSVYLMKHLSEALSISKTFTKRYVLILTLLFVFRVDSTRGVAFIAWKTKLKVVSHRVQILVFHLLSQLLCYLTVSMLLLLEILWTMSSPSILVMMPHKLGHRCRIMLSLFVMFVRSFIWLTSTKAHVRAIYPNSDSMIHHEFKWGVGHIFDVHILLCKGFLAYMYIYFRLFK